MGRAMELQWEAEPETVYTSQFVPHQALMRSQIRMRSRSGEGHGGAVVVN